MSDLISRSALLLKLRENCPDKWDADINYFICNAPTIEAVPVVHGEWKWLMRGGKTYCSKCGKLALRDQDRDDWWYYVQSDFCPYCGCKMGGAE